MPTMSIEGATCFYQDIGEGYPILFGHSYLWSSEMWKPQLMALSQEFRCIAVDLWDHGQSGCLPAQPYTLERLADDHWKLMQHLNISEFAIIGLSVGGMWGTHLALTHPKAVSALVLMDTFVGAEPPIARQRYFNLLDTLDKDQCFTHTFIEQIVPLFFSPYTLLHQQHLVDDFRKALAAIKKKNIPGITALGRAIFSRQCLLDELRTLTQPTLILAGRDDIPRPPSEAEKMFQYLPNAKLHIIDNAGHISNLEQPDLVTPLLSQFLKDGKSAFCSP